MAQSNHDFRNKMNLKMVSTISQPKVVCAMVRDTDNTSSPPLIYISYRTA